MNARRGRPRSDRLALVERVADALSDEPSASANAVHRQIGGRRRDVLRAVRILRGAVAAAHARKAA